MKHTIEDERTRGLKRQVRGEAYLLTAALLLVSLFWKTYGLGLPVTASGLALPCGATGRWTSF